MKSSDKFKETIQKFLEERASTDVLFTPIYKKENKNIDDCITYILNYVKESGICGFSDDEIYSLATHYYTEDDIKVGEKIECNVIVNHKVELTPEEIEAEKQKAKEKIFADVKEEMISKPKPKPVAPPQTSTPTLF